MKNKGFTLLELITTLVILAIIAVIALPKFINYKSDASQSLIQGVGGAIKTGLDLANARIQIDNADSSIDYLGNTIQLTAGQPTASAGTLRALLDIEVSTSWTRLWKTVPCAEPEFCILGNMYPGKSNYVPVPGYDLTGSFVGENRVAYIWPKGYLLETDGCYSFYINNASTNSVYSGSITDGC